MTQYPLPIEIVKGKRPYVTQEYGDQTNVAWYKANGVNIDAHNGTDIVVVGNSTYKPSDTYGTKLVCPVPTGLLDKAWFDQPLSTQGNGVRIRWRDERGLVQCLVWHCSEVNQQGEYKLGDTLGYMGNSGLVSPKPSVWNVHAGSHVHIMTYVNGVLVNPREIFDFTKWFVSETDTGIEKDLPPFAYFLNQIRLNLAKLVPVDK